MNKIVANFKTSGGEYDITKDDFGVYNILLNGESIHGDCNADNVISWFSNALHNAEYLLMKQEKKNRELPKS